jgi:aspartyl/asparaginyl-tRNA synthetase
MSKQKRVNIQNLTTYNKLIGLLRDFFLQRGFIEVATQPNLTILSACENPFSVATYNYNGILWPLPQTGQMILEEVLLNNPDIPGCFCISTSYRDEKNPIPGRHEKIFNMFEFESKGTIEDLKKMERDLLVYLGFGEPKEAKYEDMCLEYGGVDILEDEHESRMWREIGPVVSLQEFPLRTSPFYNMLMNDKGTFNKIDVILYGQETIGSAERSSDPEVMKELFYTISGGGYANKLFELFGKERVEEELEDFLSHNFFPRFGGGIGMTRLSRAWNMLQEDKKMMSGINNIKSVETLA